MTDGHTYRGSGEYGYGPEQTVTVSPNEPQSSDGSYTDVDEIFGQKCSVHVEAMNHTCFGANIGGMRCYWVIDGVREVDHADGSVTVVRNRGEQIRLRLSVEPEEAVRTS